MLRRHGTCCGGIRASDGRLEGLQAMVSSSRRRRGSSVGDILCMGVRRASMCRLIRVSNVVIMIVVLVVMRVGALLRRVGVSCGRVGPWRHWRWRITGR